MFEREAEDYSIDTYETCLYDNLPYMNDSRAREESFRDGATFGYNKANEWHYVKDGDLPKNSTAVLVILKNKRMKISTFMENKFTIWNNDYDAYTKLYDVIAWHELPKFEE